MSAKELKQLEHDIKNNPTKLHSAARNSAQSIVEYYSLTNRKTFPTRTTKLLMQLAFMDGAAEALNRKISHETRSR